MVSAINSDWYLFLTIIFLKKDDHNHEISENLQKDELGFENDYEMEGMS